MQEKKFTEHKALLPFLKRIMTYALRYRVWFFSFIGFTILTAIAEALAPLAVVGMFDKVIVPQLEQVRQNNEYIVDYQSIAYYGELYFVLSIIAVIGIFQFIKYAGLIQENVISQLRQDMFEKLQRLQFSYFDRTASGWLLTRISSDTDRVSEVVSWGLVEAVWGTAMIVSCATAMLWYDWRLALVVILSVPVMLLASVHIRKLGLRYSRETRRINSEVTAAFTEHINGVVVTKSTAQEGRVSENFNQLSQKMRDGQYKASFYTAMYMPIVITVGAVATAIVLFWGGEMTMMKPLGISLGVYFAAFEYAKKIYEPITDLTKFYATAQSSLSAGERIFNLLDEPILVYDTEGVVEVEKIKGDIEFHNVSFYYDVKNPVLKDFNLTIPAGQSIALVGATGEGKSTIVNLVARFYEPIEGQILIDGLDYKSMTLNSLRRQLGVVLQTPHLFSGTIRDNLLYGNLSATTEQIEFALQTVGAENFTNRLDEEVGESGEKLSMGERQLLSFARALLAEPRIFIMDEATSSIDTLTEAKIQRGINSILRDRTSIVIAHRLSTIKNCDRILVIKKGQIIEDGSHGDLILLRGHYYRLYTHQLRDERASQYVAN